MHRNDQCTMPECQNMNNIPKDHLGSNFEAQDPQPILHCSTHQCFKSEYHKWLQEGEGTVNGCGDACGQMEMPGCINRGV